MTPSRKHRVFSISAQSAAARADNNWRRPHVDIEVFHLRVLVSAKFSSRHVLSWLRRDLVSWICSTVICWRLCQNQEGATGSLQGA
jgi:hypothetical protein